MWLGIGRVELLSKEASNHQRAWTTESCFSEGGRFYLSIYMYIRMLKLHQRSKQKLFNTTSNLCMQWAFQKTAKTLVNYKKLEYTVVFNSVCWCIFCGWGGEREIFHLTNKTENVYCKKVSNSHWGISYTIRKHFGNVLSSTNMEKKLPKWQTQKVNRKSSQAYHTQLGNI